MTNIKSIALSVGDPAGIGPDILVELAQHDWPCEFVIHANEALLHQRARELNKPLTFTPQFRIADQALNASVTPGIGNPDNSEYVLRCLEAATNSCLNGEIDALVTGPVNKEVISNAGIAFTGHTEYLRTQCNADHTIMLFVTPKHRLALLTTHLPLSKVPGAITQKALRQTLSLLHTEMQTRFNIAAPHIGVCGLNPHAGEGGHLGREEIETIIPTLNTLRKEGLHLTGPLPADTIFLPQAEPFDVILAMYHDQALPVIKTLAFEEAINVTLGLPIIRTSVDHGTAFPLAGTGKACAKNICAAVKLALNLSN